MTMPRKSILAKRKTRLAAILKKLEYELEIRVALKLECNIVQTMYDSYLMEYCRLKSSRYGFRESVHRDRSLVWKNMLGSYDSFNDTEFLAEFRMNRDMFERLYYMIRDSSSFQFNARRECLPVQLHLLVCLYFLGGNGNNCTAIKIGVKFGISSGSVFNMIERTIDAILEMRDETISWPDEQERQQISDHIHSNFGFANCVGIADGTYFPLEFKPTLKGETYYTRKGNYAVQGFIVCDHKARIRWLKLGWAGSVHDNRVWSTCDMNIFRERFFDNRQYILGDSAFKASSVMVPSFKKPYRGLLNPQQEHFNTMLAKIRIRSEHCIGLLKGRFQYLKRARILIKNRNRMIRLMRFIVSSCILHNILINERVPDEWLDGVHGYDSDEDDGELDDDDELNQPVPLLHENDDTRRSQVFAYILERTGF